METVDGNLSNEASPDNQNVNRNQHVKSGRRSCDLISSAESSPKCSSPKLRKMEIDIESVTDEISPDDVILAQNQRRKSCRRSLVMLPTCESPLGCSSPKVRMPRRSLGRSFHTLCASPVPSSSRLRKSYSLQENTLTYDHVPCEANPQQIESISTTRLQSAKTESVTPCERSPSPLPENNSPPLVGNTTPIQSLPAASPHEVPLIDSADALYENYLREIEAWPKFLEKMEKKVTQVRLPKSFPSEDQLADNPVLAPFAGILSGKDKFDSFVALRRIRRATCLAMTALSRTVNTRKRVGLANARLKIQLDLVRKTELSQLLPFVVDCHKPCIGQLFELSDSLLNESG